MTYPVLPTLREFEDYSGEKLDSKLTGDIKNSATMAEKLFQRSYRTILKGLPGIITTDLDSDDEDNWKILIMEQAEFFLSVGDRVLTGEDKSDLSPNVPELAKTFALWSHSARRC